MTTSADIHNQPVSHFTPTQHHSTTKFVIPAVAIALSLPIYLARLVRACWLLVGSVFLFFSSQAAAAFRFSILSCISHFLSLFLPLQHTLELSLYPSFRHSIPLFSLHILSSQLHYIDLVRKSSASLLVLLACCFFLYSYPINTMSLSDASRPNSLPNGHSDPVSILDVGSNHGLHRPLEPRSLSALNQNIFVPGAPFDQQQILGSAFQPVPHNSFDLEEMKRALDTSSLPVNPLSGRNPHIDAASSFENVPPKRARYQPAFSSSSPSIGGSYLQQPIMSPGNGPQSSHHFNVPLSAGPLATPTQPPNIVQGMNSPYGMGVMGMNFGMPYGLGYPQSPILSPSMNPNNMTGNYGPAAAAAAAAAAGNATGRTVYVGNLPGDASVDELLNLVRFGPIENVRILAEKNCCFISFLDGSTAAAFHADASVKKLALHGQELKIGWGKASALPSSVATAVHTAQATRNVYVGNLPPETSESDLREVCKNFGDIDQVKIVRDKNIGFIHFLSISTAIKVVQTLPTLEGWQDRRVNYGKDRCAYVPRAQQAAVHAAQAQAQAAVASQVAQMPGTPFTPFTPSFAAFGSPASAGFASPLFPGGGFQSMTAQYMDATSAGNQGNRQIYLGNIHPDTTTEELCNNIRGGMLQSIRHMHDKHIAFVTFVDPLHALAFYNHANVTGLTINSRRLKVSWGKPSGPLSVTLLQAVNAGASRNVYIGGVPDFEKFSEERLRTDFGEHGEIEMINFLKEKSAAFVNFTSIQSAQKAVEAIKLNPDYQALRIAYGKDRCANQPRTGPTPTPRRSDSGNVPRVDPADPIAQKIAAVEASESTNVVGAEDGVYAVEDDFVPSQPTPPAEASE
ncbi:hypothetical protein BCR39DRAFT_535461 [Naematelia encephala]|uniref:RRM domain-containing protein n=1 Tax=Naematelia encephala TaxID=71784 RepID=A0A1Y2B2K9_9TREE|nr:hypothetical protein BCR39DRAFT_535461 [Naematelia encephala]